MHTMDEPAVKWRAAKRAAVIAATYVLIALAFTATGYDSLTGHPGQQALFVAFGWLGEWMFGLDWLFNMPPVFSLLLFFELIWGCAYLVLRGAQRLRNPPPSS
jgi:hypothetical protein